MTIHFYYPTFELFCFSFTRLSLKILFTQPFSLRCHPPPSIMIGPLRTYLLIVQTLTIQRSVVQSRISANPGLKCNLLFQFMYFCTFVYFKTSEKKIITDQDKISKEIFSNLYTSCWEVCFEFQVNQANRLLNNRPQDDCFTL